MINQDSIRAAATSGTPLVELTPTAGQEFGPWTVLTVGSGPEFVWFRNQPDGTGICLPDGTVVEMFHDVRQVFQLKGTSLVPSHFVDLQD